MYSSSSGCFHGWPLLAKTGGGRGGTMMVSLDDLRRRAGESVGSSLMDTGGVAVEEGRGRGRNGLGDRAAPRDRPVVVRGI